MDEFKEYLKDTHKCKTLDSLQKKFDEIALHFLRYGVIVVSKEADFSSTEMEFLPTEIEIYFNDQRIHADPYTHGWNKQLEFGSWYLHKYGINPKGKIFDDITKKFTHNRTGLDITFGDGSKIHAGILIRSIKERYSENKSVIEGPNKSLRELLQLQDKKLPERNPEQLVELFGSAKKEGTAFESNYLYIKFTHIQKEPLYKAQRKLGKTIRSSFYNKQLYRYFTIKPKAHKPQDCHLLEEPSDKTD